MNKRLQVSILCNTMPSSSNSVHSSFSPGREFSSSQQQAQHESTQIGLSHGTLPYPYNKATSVFVHKESRERNYGFRKYSSGFDMRHGDDATVLCHGESDGVFSPLLCASPHHDHKTEELLSFTNPHHTCPQHGEIHVQHTETHPHHQHDLLHLETHAQHSVTHMHASPQHPHPHLHAYAHPYQHSHTHPYEGGGVYPHRSPDLCAPQPHQNNANANANANLDIQPHSQQHISLEEIMPHDLLPHSNQTPSSSYTQGCDVNGIAIGVPGMGKPIYYMDNCSHVISPPSMPFTNVQMDDHVSKSQGNFHREAPCPRKGQKEKHYSKDTPDNHFNHHRGTCEADFRELHYNQGMCGRSNMNHRPNEQELHCAPCDRAFRNQGDFNAHLKSHVKCSEEGCKFEASGKIVKEHKVAEHGKVAVTTSAIGHKVLALCSMEDKDDVCRWREERKKNYPTLANVIRKQMKEVLDRQKKLGFQVAEIPPKYLMPRNDNQQQPGRLENKEYNMVSEHKSGNANKRPLNSHSHACKTPLGNDDTLGADEQISLIEEKSKEIENPDDDKVPPIRTEKDQVKPRRERVPRRKRRKKHFPSHDTMQLQQRPILLSELLKRDAGKANSHLLQCLRFIVNNCFLQSTSSILHFPWAGARVITMDDGPSLMSNI